MKFYCAIAFLVAMLAISATVASAAIPPAPAQAVAAAQGAPVPQAGAAPQNAYTYTFSGPANPAVRPPSPGNAGADASRYRWSDDRWWYWSPDNRWLMYGQNGWNYPLGQSRPNVTTMPSGYSYGPVGSTYYSYPRFGNYYPSRFPMNNPGMFGNPGMFSR
jgi:hypothetical protein